MLRKAVLILCLVALAVPASAAVNVSNGANPQAVTINLTIPGYTNVWWNPPGSANSPDGNDQTITFNDIVQNGSNGGDWWSNVLTGAYGAATAASTDPFAEDYFESYDHANFWLESNVDCQMQLTSSGDLTNGPATMPTWYTVALTNIVDQVNPGFIDGGVPKFDGIIPLSGGPGSYADDNPADGVMELFGGAFYPGQYSFPMAGTYATYTGNFTAFAQGTILFHARVLRAGISDPNGTYTATLTVMFY